MTSGADNLSLLEQQTQLPSETGGSQADPEEIDRRFAIDEEYAERDGEEEEGETARLHASNDDGPGSPKYPPSAPPPSYREATGRSRLTHALNLLSHSLSLPPIHFTWAKTLFSKAWYFICRFWPTSRFAQVGFFLVGLWLLVIVSGPAFEDMGPRVGAGYPFEAVAHDPPEPISGDGHIEEPATWTLKRCHHSKAHHRRVLCVSNTRFDLDVPAMNMGSTDGIFIFADPPRSNHLSDGRGQVPGTIEFEMVPKGDGSGNSVAEGKIRVDIDAEYEQNSEDLLQRSTVARMGAGTMSKGVGIYTHPLPLYFQRKGLFPPLAFHIKIKLPSGARIPSLRTQTSAMNVGAFTKAIEVAPFGADGIRSQNPTDSTSLRRDDPLDWPKFGRFHIQTGSGQIDTSKDVPIEAHGNIRLTSNSGDVLVRGKIWSMEVYLENHNGRITLEEGSQVEGWYSLSIDSHNGPVVLLRNSKASATNLYGRTGNGGITGGVDGGVWSTNSTLELTSANGKVAAAVDVRKGGRVDGTPADQVNVKVESQNGGVQILYVGHEDFVALQSVASTSTNMVDVTMHPNFEGLFSMEGGKGSVVIPSPKKDDRRFKSEGRDERPLRVSEKGSIWRPADKTKVDSTLKPNTSIKSATGPAQLRLA